MGKRARGGEVKEGDCRSSHPSALLPRCSVLHPDSTNAPPVRSLSVSLFAHRSSTQPAVYTSLHLLSHDHDIFLSTTVSTSPAPLSTNTGSGLMHCFFIYKLLKYIYNEIYIFHNCFSVGENNQVYFVLVSFFNLISDITVV